MKRRDLDGKVVLISGAAGGLGAALARRYGIAGSLIAALDVNATQLDTLVANLQSLGVRALAIHADITDAHACQQAVAASLQHFGRIDGLINNAGISHRSLLSNTRPEVIRSVMEVNFFGALHLTQAALPHLTARQGFIAAVSSVAGFAPLIGRTGYAASKHAMHGFFDSLRSELEGTGVSVTLICPSFIQTGIGAAALGGDGRGATSARLTSGGESSAEEIAERIFEAIARHRHRLLPDRTSRIAWWTSRLMPALYARMMKHRLGTEFDAPRTVNSGHP